LEFLGSANSKLIEPTSLAPALIPASIISPARAIF